MKMTQDKRNTESNYSSKELQCTIQELFEKQVISNPNKTALVFNESHLTYSELNSKANQLARILRTKGVQKDNIVSIMTDPCLEMIIGILAIHKAGGAYLPIDSSYPKDRIDYMLEDSKSKILLTQGHLASNCNFNGEIINLEDQALYTGDNSNPDNINTPEDLAYVIYTSGSTGKPKGVLVEHKSLVNLCIWHNNYFEVTDKDVSSKYAGFGFDASVWEIFPYITIGASIHIIDKSIRLDVNKLNEYFEKNKITISFLPTQLCEQFILLENKHLRKLLTGGDKLKTFTRKNYDIVNNYGPTENTVVTTCFVVDKYYENIPIGKPVDNTEIYIIDQNNNLAEPGAEGELCVSGIGLARGYLNRPDLTAEKFIDNPFASGEKMYRTGDLVRLNEAGDLEFLGRIDNQVKIRGFRIELGEIEACLQKHKAVSQAVVVDKIDSQGYKYLCAYVLLKDKISSARILREHLLKDLPSYMVPVFFVEIDEMPITPNGKVDRKALPEPDENNIINNEYAEPEDELQEALVAMWKDILEIPVVSIDDSFFELGGHSLNASILASKIFSSFKVNIPLEEIFKSPTIRAISKFISNSSISTIEEIKPAEEREYYPLSSAQNRLFMLNTMDKNNISYNNPIIINMSGNVDIDKLERAFKLLIKRQESLRTSFKLINDEPAQKIWKDIDFKLDRVDASEFNIDDILVEPFDLSKAPLFKAKFITLPDNKYVLFMDFHHIIFDGTSLGIVLKELTKLYNDESLEALNINYKDYAVWQQEYLNSDALKKQEDFWSNMFRDELPVLNLPTDFPRPGFKSFEGERISFEIDKKLTQKLKALSNANSSTLYMVLFSAYNILLSKYSNQEDIIVGSPSAGRQLTDLHDIVGMFVNTLAFRNYPKGDIRYTDFLKEIKENTLRAYANQDYPLEDLVSKLNLNRDPSRNPLFDTIFVLQNEEIGNLDIDGLKCDSYILEYQGSKVDLLLEATERENGISFIFEYCSKLFKKETIERMAKHFTNILEEIIDEPELRLSQINMMSIAETEQILNEFNDTYSIYPRNKTIHELFEAQAAKKPNKPAVIFNDKELTYKELNDTANSLASVLRKKGVGPDSIVGIMVEKSHEMMIGILGILKAGGAYLPIDRKYPDERIKYMLQDSGAKILLSQKNILDELDLEQLEYNGIIIDLFEDELYTKSTPNLKLINKPSDLAYIIYTSGSTGKPKGVMVEHKNVIRLVINTNYINFDEDERILQTGSIVFDASTFEFWASLLNGFSLYLGDEFIILNAENMKSTIQKYNITTLWMTSPLFNQLSQQDAEIFAGVRNLLVGGDALSPKHINMARNANKNLNIINGYGPTENTTFSVCFSIDKDYEFNIPIGRPISNSTAYILNKYNKLQPIGIPGELCLGGDGVARGYVNAEELTNRKFVRDPYRPNYKMYRSGDMARWLPDGTIEFLGRMDNQVKVRGFRIELGEIETQLLKHGSIKEGTVIVKEDASGAKYLCAYFVADKKLTVSELRKHLTENLPDYMIPSYFVQLESMPLTPNGKIDKKLLPEPEGSINTGAEYVAPEGTAERKIADVWKEVLNIDRVSIEDNFFYIGGNSLKAIQIVSKLMVDFDITINHIFKHQTIRELAKHIILKENNLRAKLDKLKENYKIQAKSSLEDSSLKAELKAYEGKNKKYLSIDLKETSDYKNILITGATGYLGSNLVGQLLRNTNLNVYTIIRGNSLEAAKSRVKGKLEFYFGQDLLNTYGNRLFILGGDLSKDKLGLSDENYVSLSNNIDAVINCAANVKHYGKYNEFYEANIKSVENLITFAADSKVKDLHHVSTISVASGLINNVESVLFTEYDHDLGQKTDNYYAQTKLEAEKLILKARERGLNCNIYRLGNITFNSHSGVFQENIGDNAFYSLMRSYIKLNAMPDLKAEDLDFSFVDYVCNSIIELMKVNNLKNETFHIYNPNCISLSSMRSILNDIGFNIKELNYDKFLDLMYEGYSNPKLAPFIETILLHTHAIEQIGETAFNVNCDKTILILKELGFNWPSVNSDHIKNMIEYCKKVNFI